MKRSMWHTVSSGYSRVQSMWYFAGQVVDRTYSSIRSTLRRWWHWWRYRTFSSHEGDSNREPKVETVVADSYQRRSGRQLPTTFVYMGKCPRRIVFPGAAQGIPQTVKSMDADVDVSVDRNTTRCHRLTYDERVAAWRNDCSRQWRRRRRTERPSRATHVVQTVCRNLYAKMLVYEETSAAYNVHAKERTGSSAAGQEKECAAIATVKEYNQVQMFEVEDSPSSSGPGAKSLKESLDVEVVSTQGAHGSSILQVSQMDVGAVVAQKVVRTDGVPRRIEDFFQINKSGLDYYTNTLRKYSTCDWN